MNSRNTSGFTLVELMVTLMVASIVFGIGVPAFNGFIATNQMAAAANDITSSLHLARTEAVKRRTNVTLCASSDWNTAAPTCNNGASLGNGWIVFVDCTVAPPPVGTCGAPNLVVDGFDTVVATHGPMQGNIANNFTTNPGNPEYLSFSATGFPRPIVGLGQPKTDFLLCDNRGNTDIGGGVAAGRWIRISPTGRPQIFRMQVDVQSMLGGC